MDPRTLVDHLFRSVDAMDTDTFLSFLTEDITFRFGNAPAVTGKQAVNEAVTGFFNAIKSLHHTIDQVWSQDNHIICKGTATYTRKDDSTLTVPFANIFRIHEEKISEYLIYVDISQLFPQ